MAKNIDCRLKKNKNNSKCKKVKKIKCNIGEARMSLILPKRDNSGRPIKAKYHQEYIQKMNDIFGGTSTIPRIEGCVFDEKGKFQCEQNIEIIGIRDFQNPYDKIYGSDKSMFSCARRKKQLKQDWDAVKKLSQSAKKEFGQESVLAINDKINDAYLSFQKKPKKVPDNRIGKKVIFS